MKLASSSSPWRFVATAVVVLLLVALNAHEALGAAGSPIIFGMSTPTNATANPAAQLGARFAYGIQLAFKEVNTAYGGVNGHPLQLLVQDDNYLLANTMANVASMIDNLGVFAIAGVIGAEQSQGTFLDYSLYLVKFRACLFGPFCVSCAPLFFKKISFYFNYISVWAVVAACADPTHFPNPKERRTCAP